VDEAVDLFTQQESNRRRTRRLVLVFVLFFAWLGFGGDWLLWQVTREAAGEGYRHVVPWGGLALTTLAVVLAWWARQVGPERVLAAAGAQELEHPRTPEQVQLFNVVNEMSIAAGIPRPRIHLVPDADPNAFATGFTPEGSHIAVTEGLLALCSRDELQAVVAHEVGHITNLDVRLMTQLAGLVGAVALVSDGVGRMMRHGARGRFPVRIGGRGKRGGNLGPLVLIVLVLWIVSWLLAPLVCRLLALGVSRKREFLADAMSAQFTRNPAALASALEKIERAAAPTTSIRQASAHLCIADPLGRRVNLRQGRLADLLGTHPPMPLRVARLRAMAHQQLKRGGGMPVPA
jgi:heat shock protein HtpX